MASMFETIMNLPLLKGITKEQVAQFLEHTNVRFTDYAPGQTVAPAGMEVRDLSFLINGELRLSHVSQSGRFTVHYTAPSGHPLFAFRLFGLSNVAPASAVALTPLTVLSFPKADYLNLLRMDYIYQICALNYLSARIQYASQAALTDADNSLALWITRSLLTLTPRAAHNIEIEVTPDNLVSITGLSEASIKSEIRVLSELGLVGVTKKGIAVINRNELIDYALHSEDNVMEKN